MTNQQTVAYVRVSTEEQVEYSPDAQAKRCKDFARLRDLGPIRVFTDQGWSGKNLDRPAMRDLLDLIGTGAVSDLMVWRWDRLKSGSGRLLEAGQAVRPPRGPGPLGQRGRPRPR